MEHVNIRKKKHNDSFLTGNICECDPTNNNAIKLKYKCTCTTMSEITEQICVKAAYILY